MRLTKNQKILLRYSERENGNMTSLEKRGIFLKQIGIEPEEIVAINLEHGYKVKKVTEVDKAKVFKCDALITNQPNLILFLMTADCMPISLFDKENNVIALIHGGRKNLDKIIKNTIEKMKKEFGTKPYNLNAEFGPSIGPCCYNLNIWELAKNQLKEAGVLEENIYNPEICTYHTNNYFSHRKMIVNEGKDDFIRFATVFEIKK